MKGLNMHAEKCPVCCGTGKIANDGKTTDATDKVCHGCGGKGWVTVENTTENVVATFVTNCGH